MSMIGTKAEDLVRRLETASADLECAADEAQTVISDEDLVARHLGTVRRVARDLERTAREILRDSVTAAGSRR